MNLKNLVSHPVRVRGLKQYSSPFEQKATESHPVRVRGLKHIIFIVSASADSVAPRAGAWIETRMRPARLYSKWSHPVRVRGLKLSVIVVACKVGDVAPRAGAWIETGVNDQMSPLKFGRTPCGCVD